MMKSFMKLAICFPFGYINGQKYENGQTVIIKLLSLCKVLNDV